MKRSKWIVMIGIAFRAIKVFKKGGMPGLPDLLVKKQSNCDRKETNCEGNRSYIYQLFVLFRSLGARLPRGRPKSSDFSPILRVRFSEPVRGSLCYKAVRGPSANSTSCRRWAKLKGLILFIQSKMCFLRIYLN